MILSALVIGTKIMKLEYKDYFVAGLIILVALAAGLISAWQYIDAAKTERKKEQLQSELKASADSLAIAQKESLYKADKLITAQEENNRIAIDLIAAQKKINHLQNETLKEIIGDGYPIVEFSNYGDNSVRTKISNNSKYLFRIDEYIITDCKELLKRGIKEEGNFKIHRDDYFKVSKVFTGDNILPTGFLPTNYTFLKDETKYISTLIKALNVSTIQYSVIKFKGENIDHEYKIFKLEDNNSFRLLEEKGNSVSEKEWEDKFPFKMTVHIFRL